MQEDPLIGTLLAGKYAIEGKLGQGGMGTVYRAVQRPIDRPVAVKVLLESLSKDDMAVARFEREAMAISRMQHPNTVTVFDYGRTPEGLLYIAMELLAGRTLSDMLRAEGALPPVRAGRIAMQVLASLEHAHGLGIVHRDLKPDNIFVRELGHDDFVKVLDFGVAKITQDDGVNLTRTGMVFGTPKYMAPEQADGSGIDARADVYALGVVLFEVLSGAPPFVADSPVTLLLKHITEPPPSFEQVRPGHEIPPALEAVVRRALAKRREDRFASAAEMAQAIQLAVTSELPAVAPPPVDGAPRPRSDVHLPPPPPPPPPPPSTGPAAAVFAVAVLLAGGMIGYALWQRSQPSVEVTTVEAVAEDAGRAPPAPSPVVPAEADAGVAAPPPRPVARPERPVERPPPRTERPRPKVVIELVSDPVGARVLDPKGEEVCPRTPCVRTFDRSRKTRSYVFVFPDGARQVKAVRFDKSKRVGATRANVGGRDPLDERVDDLKGLDPSR